MWTERDIQVIHLEPTDVCQASCPQCSRETDASFDANRRHHLTVDQLQRIIPTSVLESLQKVLLCGCYGDPAAGRHSLEIMQWFRSHQPDVTLGLHSNGGIASPDWWRELARIMRGQRDYVIFSIDGLEDTNAVYRRGVSWSRIMQNVKAYVSEGGPAHWEMLVYQHNEHQVDQCQALARELGFRWFRAKVTRRPLTAGLSLPKAWQDPRVVAGTVACHALAERSIYIDAQARVSPCCWLGDTQQPLPYDFQTIQQSWNTNKPNMTCVRVCGQDHRGSSFSNQWQREVDLCLH